MEKLKLYYMAKISENQIPDLSADWAFDETNGLPYAGQAVQDFIKQFCRKSVDNEQNKVGGFFFDTAEMKLYMFRSEEDKDAFLSNGDESLILSSQDIVFGGTQRKFSIVNKMGSSNIYFTTNAKKAEITVGFESKEKDFNAPEWTEVIEDAYFTVSVDKGVSGNYVTILENQLVRHGETLTFDVYNYIASGANRVKVSAKGTVTEQTASFGYSVTVTSMYLSPANFAWYTPFIENSSYSLGGMNIGGALQKKLIIKVTNDNGYSEQYEENIGTAVYVTNPYYYTKLPFPSEGTGVYHVELWLDAGGLQSDHLHYNIMCISASDIATAKLCCIADVAEEVTNYQENTLFNYSVYNGGSSSATPHIKLEATANDSPIVILDEELSNVETGKMIPFRYNIEIETEGSDLSLTSLLSFGNEQSATYKVDNSASFPASSGAVFYMNAATRSNSQPNKTTIINETDKGNITASWTNMSWVDGTDGWTTDNEGRKCLLMPARAKAEIQYKPLQTVGTGKTIEFTFKVSNASDYDENIISIADAPANAKFRGIRIRPNSITAHSRDLNTDDPNQSYNILEDNLINICISIIRNYKTNYGNLCIIYANGVRKKEFAFTNADSWITDGNIIIGSDTADLYLYNIRVYDKGFGTQDALQNYVATLPNSIDKRKASAIINSVIDDSYNIDYEKTKSVANVVTIEMLNGSELPHYGLSKEYSAQCNMEVFWNKNPEWNWSIDNIKIEGQGTTSMNYFRWNLRWRLDKSSGYTIHYADGSTSQEDKIWFDGEENHPKLSRLTAKINYASSMQSHKIGATAMYNDVHHHIGLDNEVNGRVAVYQKPFYFFQKIKIEGTEQYTYQFMGLFTFGADKGDKNTFGFKNPEVKDPVMSLEGMDHSIKGVGMEYPYSQMKYVEEEECLCVDKGNNVYDAAWEVSVAGGAETEEEIQAKLDTEFKPAYEVAYNNSTLIIGTDESLDTINSDVEAWGQKVDKYGNPYQRFQFWIDGEYEIYYLSKKTNKYEKDGTNLLTQLGLSTEDIQGKSIEEKNELFKEKRREKFKAEMQNYWHLDDALYHLCFLLLVGATDNFKKNSYPYKLNTLESGSRWRWRQDDLDTLFDIDNQGLAVKGYSIEMHDFTDASKTAYVFKGEDSVFWTLVDECFPDEEKTMGKKILQAMYDMSDTGSNTIDRLMGFMQKYFWNNAQSYFTKSAYNADAEYKYEEAWPKYANGEYDVDVHPLSQSLGDHIEAEMAWVKRRLIYMMSKWGFGPFAQYTDTCLGRINFRTQLAQSFKLTPFLDLYPTILSGQGAVHASPDRVLSGNEVSITGAGGTNTNVYIMAADELEDIGDLSTLTVDAAANAGISIASKRLRKIKVGDATADKVTSNLQTLSIGQCNSLESIDARNLKSLTGTIDLSRCPRLTEAYFSGTDVRSVTLANGAKITKLEISDATTVLELLNLTKLTELDYNVLDKLEFFRVENSMNVNPFDILKEIYNQEESKLKDIRLIGFNYNGTSSDLDILANLANDLDKDGEPHQYNGIDSNGVANSEMLPIIEGSLTLEGSAFEDSVATIKKLFPNIVLVVNGKLYVRFADPEVSRILATRIGDGTGVLYEDILKVGNGTLSFKSNQVIQSFDELEKFTGITSTTVSMFANCSNLESITLPDSITEILADSFSTCSKLKYFELPASITSISQVAFNSCTNYIGELNLPNLTNIGKGAFRYSGITRISNLGKITVMESSADSGNGTFYNCKSLEYVVLPDTLEEIQTMAFFGCSNLKTIEFPEGLKIIGRNVFQGCSELTGELNLPNLEEIGWGAFIGTKLTKVANLGKIKILTSTTSSGNGTFANCKSLISVVLPDTLEEWQPGPFAGCTSLTSINLPQSLKIIRGSAFVSIEGVIPEEVNLPNLETLETNFRNCSGIKRIVSLGKITSLLSEQFRDCSSLTTVILPDGVTAITSYCFNGCGMLEEVTLPSSITEINNYSFSGCSKLNLDLNLPNLSTISKSSFVRSGILRISDLGTITRIPGDEFGDRPFYQCARLEYANLPSSLTSIGAGAFQECTQLKTVISNATTPPELGSKAFYLAHADLKIYVPDESVEAYKQASNWNEHSSRIHPLSEYVE